MWSLPQENSIISSWYISDIDEFPVRSKDPYDISKEDREQILETLKYWEGRSMEDMSRNALPPNIEEAIQDDIITVGLRNGVSGETTCDHEKLLTIGLKGYIKECQANIDNTIRSSQEDEEKVEFWQACIIQCEGLITYAHRMADEAERQAADCSDEKRKQELLTIAANCRVVPENPPETFQQALQMVWFAHVAFHIEVCTTACGFGRFDQYMWPFYKKDVLDEKNITETEALEMLECMYLKACEVYEVRDKWYATSFAGYPMWEILIVGGQTPDGRDATNELSYLCLEAASQLKTTQPVMALRVWDGTPEALFRKGCEMVQAGQANPGFFNDTAAIKMSLGKGCTMGVVKNIAGRKQEQQRYRESLRALLAANPKSLCTFHLNITNNTCTEGFGTSPYIINTLQADTVDDLVENVEAMILDDKYRKKFREHFSRKELIRRFESGEMQSSARYRRRMDDGSFGWVRTTVNMLNDPQTHVCRFEKGQDRRRNLQRR